MLFPVENNFDPLVSKCFPPSKFLHQDFVLQMYLVCLQMSVDMRAMLVITEFAVGLLACFIMLVGKG